MDNKQLQKIATNVRKNVIEAVYNAASGHPGGSLSIADILTVLYFDCLLYTSNMTGKSLGCHCSSYE